MNSPIKCWYIDHAFDQTEGGPCCFQPIGHIKNFREMREHEDYIKIKTNFENGKWTENFCTKCREVEDSNPNLQISKRQTSIFLYRRLTAEQAKEKKLVSIVFDTGNHCNLQCRSCSPMHSSSWVSEMQSISYVPRKEMQSHWVKDNLNKVKNITVWPSNDYDFTDDFTSLRYVNFIGGEPLYNTSFIKTALDKIYESVGSKCHISIQTNATISYKTVMPLLSRFDNVELSLSLDAIGQASDFIRTGSSWDSILENIKFYVSQKNIKLNCHTTHSVLNLFELVKLRDFLNEYNIANSDEKSFVSWPSHLKCDILTEGQREKVVAYLAENDLEYVANYVKNSNFNSNEKVKFLKFMDHTKQYHGMSWQEYLPELYDIITTEI